MVSFETATSKAKDFLCKQGIYVVRLKEVDLQGDKWIITYEDSLPFVASREKYIVELLRETGEIIAFRS